MGPVITASGREHGGGGGRQKVGRSPMKIVTTIALEITPGRCYFLELLFFKNLPYYRLLIIEVSYKMMRNFKA